MAKEDSVRWDQRYQEESRYNSFNRPRPFLVENAGFLPSCGLALDAAMGLGGNAAFLLERGLRVVGIDISEVAVRQAKERLPRLMAVQADLDLFCLPSSTFDLIVNFFFLERQLWPQYARALRPGGVLVFETMTQDMREIRPDIDPAYLLTPGELNQAFPELQTLVYREGWTENDRGHRRATAALVARKPA